MCNDTTYDSFLSEVTATLTSPSQTYVDSLSTLSSLDFIIMNKNEKFELWFETLDFTNVAQSFDINVAYTRTPSGSGAYTEHEPVKITIIN